MTEPWSRLDFPPSIPAWGLCQGRHGLPTLTTPCPGRKQVTCPTYVSLCSFEFNGSPWWILHKASHHRPVYLYFELLFPWIFFFKAVDTLFFFAVKICSLKEHKGRTHCAFFQKCLELPAYRQNKPFESCLHLQLSLKDISRLERMFYFSRYLKIAYPNKRKMWLLQVTSSYPMMNMFLIKAWAQNWVSREPLWGLIALPRHPPLWVLMLTADTRGHCVYSAVRKVISEAWQLLVLKLLWGKQKPFCSVP